jgi:dTDP-4-amino-4,6-dideoxygalactose transaminase
VLRENGISRGVDPREPWRYEVRAPGFNYRMSELHAALGLSQLAKLDGWLQERRERAALYDRLFADVAEVEIPAVAAGVEHAYHLYVIRVRDRASVFDALRAADIGAQVHYVPVHTQPYFRKRLGAVSLPHAERYYEHALSIPLYPDLAERELRRVAEVVKSTVRGAAVG